MNTQQITHKANKKFRRCKAEDIILNFLNTNTDRFYKNTNLKTFHNNNEDFFFLQSYDEIIGVIQIFPNFIIHFFDKTAKGGKYFSQSTSKHTCKLKKLIELNSLYCLYYSFDMDGKIKEPKNFLEGELNEFEYDLETHTIINDIQEYFAF
tara:strand:- start:216 stop:668 length:453 start_codon:yes stop_codon:yes gene_type:complete